MRTVVARLGRLSAWRFISLVAVLTMVPLVLLATVSITLATGAVRHEVESRVGSTTAVGVALVSQEMRGLKQLVASYATRPHLVSALGQGDPVRYRRDDVAFDLAQLLQAREDLAAAFLTDPAGRIIDTAPHTPAIVGRDYSFRDWYRGVTATGGPYVSEAYQTDVTGHALVVGVAAPVRAPGEGGRPGPVVGILVAAVALDSIEGFVGTLSRVQGIDLRVTDQRGALLAEPRTALTRLASRAGDPRIAAALRGRSGVAEAGSGGGRVLSAYEPVPGLGWTVTSEVPSATALAGVSTLRSTVIAISVLLGLVVLGMLAVLALTLRERARDRAAYDQFFDLSLELLCVADFEGHFTRVNPTWETTFGRTSEEVLARPFMDFVHPDDQEATANAAARLSTGATVVNFENRYRRSDGSYRRLAWSACASVERRVIFCSARDVTEAREAENMLRSINAELERASRVKSEFLANMSHEIRTPMNGVIGMTGLLLTTELSAEQTEYAETIRRSGEALLAVVNDVLDFSKIESGKLDLEVVDLDVRAAIEDVADLVAEAAHRKGLELTSLTEAGVPAMVGGDPGRLRQVLSNLAANAVKFTESGEVALHARVEEESDAAVMLRFEVRDSGIGIAPAVQARLFAAFSQADASTTRRFGGTGLGLAISKQLVELMGGEIGVDSEVGGGSTFWFTVRFQSRSGSDTVAPREPHRLEGLRVLVVDDNATNRAIVAQTLGGWGMDAVTASGAEEALELLRSAARRAEPFAAAALDYHMPGMDGLQLARAIRADPAIAAVRLALLTSAVQRGDARSASEAGIQAYLTKPIRQSSLHDCLATLMSGTGGAPDAPLITAHTLAEARTRAGVHLLVVEDNVVNQRVATRMLEKMGHRVDVAANGIEAVEAVSRIAYAAVLMDCQMPEMDGFDATIAIRAQQGSERHTPIIALTAGAMTDDRERCLAAGMDDFLAKPLIRRDLAAAVDRWTGPEGPSTRVPPSLDEAVIAGLRELDEATGGQVLGELIALYVTDTTVRVATLRRAVADGETAVAAGLAHGIRGSSANLGARAVADACARLEAAVGEGDPAGTVRLLALVEQEFERARAALEAELRQPAHGGGS